MRHFYESPEMEISIFSLNTSVLAASNSETEDAVGDNQKPEDGDEWEPF